MNELIIKSVLWSVMLICLALLWAYLVYLRKSLKERREGKKASETNHIKTIRRIQEQRRREQRQVEAMVDWLMDYNNSVLNIGHKVLIDFSLLNRLGLDDSVLWDYLENPANKKRVESDNTKHGLKWPLDVLEATAEDCNESLCLFELICKRMELQKKGIEQEVAAELEQQRAIGGLHRVVSNKDMKKIVEN